MNIDGQHLQSIWYEPDSGEVCIIDQTQLPHRLEVLGLKTLQDACHAIVSMQVRGAPLIGVTAAYGIHLALRADPDCFNEAKAALSATRPTAVNLRWALQRMEAFLDNSNLDSIAGKGLEFAQLLEKEDIAVCEAIGAYGAELLQAIWQEKQQNQGRLNVLTHCNAGALATVDWGTALSVVYKARNAGIPIHVWVDETRPRNQGAALTCWELSQEGIANTLVVDNAGGHLMQSGQVDVCLVGSDRTTLGGDVCNKIGTYLKALAAHDNNIPFYAAVPVSTIDFSITDGVNAIPIEERDAKEVSHITGTTEAGNTETVRIPPENTVVSNFGFDVTPARYISGIITEKGVFAANKNSLSKLLN